MITIINNETNALYNLALEEYTLKHLSTSEDILLLWQNRNSVVIGKNQNPFREVNYPYTHNSKIPIYRRLTEGETIYHDQGTINYSFIVKDHRDDKDTYNIFLNPIISILKELEVKTHIGENGDICIDGLRISLNTQSVYRKKLIHHGVIFFNANLDIFGKVLEIPEKNEFEFDKVKIQHPAITNLNKYLKKEITVKEFKTLLIDKLIGEDLTDKQYKLDYVDKTKVNKLVKEKYSTWEWTFGESPDFIIKKEFEERMMVTMMVKKGIIERVSIDSFENVMPLVKGLEGSKFDESSLKENLQLCTSIDTDKFIESILYK